MLMSGLRGRAGAGPRPRAVHEMLPPATHMHDHFAFAAQYNSGRGHDMKKGFLSGKPAVSTAPQPKQTGLRASARASAAALFQVQEVSGKGLGLVAQQDVIRAGTELIAETPLVLLPPELSADALELLTPASLSSPKPWQHCLQTSCASTASSATPLRDRPARTWQLEDQCIAVLCAWRPRLLQALCRLNVHRQNEPLLQLQLRMDLRGGQS